MLVWRRVSCRLTDQCLDAASLTGTPRMPASERLTQLVLDHGKDLASDGCGAASVVSTQ